MQLSSLNLEATGVEFMGAEFVFPIYLHNMSSYCRQNSHNHNTSTSYLNELSLLCGGFTVEILQVLTGSNYLERGTDQPDCKVISLLLGGEIRSTL